MVGKNRVDMLGKDFKENMVLAITVRNFIRSDVKIFGEKLRVQIEEKSRHVRRSFCVMPCKEIIFS